MAEDGQGRRRQESLATLSRPPQNSKGLEGSAREGFPMLEVLRASAEPSKEPLYLHCRNKNIFAKKPGISLLQIVTCGILEK